jgi:hypothetical protein
MKIPLVILIATGALAWAQEVPTPPDPPPTTPYKVNIIIERSDDLSEGFRDVITNTFWSTKSSGFYRMRMEVP